MLEWHQSFFFLLPKCLCRRNIIDPATIGLALTAASKAFSALKAGFAVGRDIESMGQDLSRWMGAASDIDNAEKQTKNPSA